jgi:phosphoribosyl-ATP pyrophosphohydrolase
MFFSPLPGLTRAVKLQTKASNVGFDWNEARLVLAKIREETDEIEAALDARESAAIAEEVGDLLFSVANLARHVEADPEAAIRRANAKFELRFRFVDDALAAKGMAPGAAALAEMETLGTWRSNRKSRSHHDGLWFGHAPGRVPGTSQSPPLHGSKWAPRFTHALRRRETSAAPAPRVPARPEPGHERRRPPPCFCT